jgi:murein DD-endopeptidase MepM/ murein hydrolase activator NlpD
MNRTFMIDNRRRSPLVAFSIIIILILLAAIALNIFRVGGAPEIKMEAAQPVIGKSTAITVQVAERGRGLSRVRIELDQEGKIERLADKSYSFPSMISFWGPKTEQDEIRLDVGRQKIPSLKAGKATIRVTADRTGTWLFHPDPIKQELTLPVRLTPPSIQILSSQTYVAQGGSEVVIYRVGESSVRDGVRSGSWWFPGYPLPGGGKQDRFAFFAVPYSMAAPDARLVAEDGAGNSAEVPFIDQFFAKQFKSDTLPISDSFLAKVVPEILSQSPNIQDGGNPLDSYLAINGELRQANAELLKELARKSKPEFLWSRPFLMMPNGKVMAGFGDRRTYEYNGRVIDHQDHLGYDFAVTQQAPIPAANDGIVLYAAYLGIYGNAVVIDHGYGLTSLYGHMSSIAVVEEQKIARGDILGRTGQTGLAAGDHLHFSVLLQGLPVNSAEWWDGHWIRDRIAKKMGTAFPFSE